MTTKQTKAQLLARIAELEAAEQARRLITGYRRIGIAKIKERRDPQTNKLAKYVAIMKNGAEPEFINWVCTHDVGTTVEIWTNGQY